MKIELTRPPSLRTYLDEGGDLTILRRLRLLIEAAAEIPFTTQEEIERSTSLERWEVENYLSGGKMDGLGERSVEHLQDMMILSAWRADLLEEPDLVPRLLDAVSPELRAMYARDLDLRRHPFPLRIEPLSAKGWSCANCGKVHNAADRAEGLVITEREGWSDYDLYIAYCASCVIMAADALRGGADR